MALLNFYKTLENATRRPMTSSIGQQDFPSSDAGVYSLQQGCVGTPAPAFQYSLLLSLQQTAYVPNHLPRWITDSNCSSTLPLDKHRLDVEESGIRRKGIELKVRARMRRGAAGLLVWNSVTFSGAWVRLRVPFRGTRSFTLRFAGINVTIKSERKYF